MMRSCACINLTYALSVDYFIHFESYLNPKHGNRNLEADPDKLIEIRPRYKVAALGGGKHFTLAERIFTIEIFPYSRIL